MKQISAWGVPAWFFWQRRFLSTRYDPAVGTSLALRTAAFAFRPFMIKPDIPGADRIVGWYGEWPSFHDAEILSFHLNRNGESSIRLHMWKISDKLDRNGAFMREDEKVVVFTFADIRWLKIEGEDANRQNVIGALLVEKQADTYRLELGPCYGLSGEILAGEISVGLESLHAYDPEPRRLNETEWQVFDALLSIDFPGRDEIREQIKNARVRTIDENGSLEILSVGSHQAPVVRRVPVEAEGRDADGTAVHVLLHVVDGKATELELYRIDGARIQAWPGRDGWELFAPSGPRNSQG